MMCKVTKEDAVKLNLMSDQVFNLIGLQGMSPAMRLLSMTGASLCLQSDALAHGVGNQLMVALLAHRQSHGEFKEIDNIGELKKHPEIFLALVGDFNELFGAIMKSLDPEHDYMFNLFKMERKSDTGKKG